VSKICWKCGQKIGLFDKANSFIERSTNKRTWLHNGCYLELSKGEKKKFLYDIKAGPPKGLRKNFKLHWFAYGIAGAAVAGQGTFSGRVWATKRILKKRGWSFEKLDDICIDRYDYHYVILPDKLQNEILKETKEEKKERGDTYSLDGDIKLKSEKVRCVY